MSNSALTFGPTFSTLLKSKVLPNDLSKFDFISSIIFLLLLISNLIRKSVSLPKFFTETSPKFIEFKLSLRDDTLILLSVDLNSINVPPLKSIPKLRPLKVSKNKEITTKDIESMLN